MQLEEAKEILNESGYKVLNPNGGEVKFHDVFEEVQAILNNLNNLDYQNSPEELEVYSKIYPELKLIYKEIKKLY